MCHNLKKYISIFFNITNKIKSFIFFSSFIIFSTFYYDLLRAFDFFGKKEGVGIIEQLGGDFKLTGPDRVKISTLNFRGKILLINFGYTYCPDVCPMTLTHLKQIMLELGGLSENVQVFFVSVDPERDTPEKLKDYVPYFDSTFIGLTGSDKEIRDVAKMFGSYFLKQEVESEIKYFMAHMEGVFLVDQKGRVRGKYKTNQDLEKLVSDIKWLIKPNS